METNDTKQETERQLGSQNKSEDRDKKRFELRVTDTGLQKASQRSMHSAQPAATIWRQLCQNSTC